MNFGLIIFILQDILLCENWRNGILSELRKRRMQNMEIKRKENGESLKRLQCLFC